MKIVESSLSFDNNMYRVGIPWRVEERTLPNNYNMALRRLSNTEKRLEKSPDIAAAYNEIIGQYIVKGYIRKVPKHYSTKPSGTSHIFQFYGQTRKRQRRESCLTRQQSAKEHP